MNLDPKQISQIRDQMRERIEAHIKAGPRWYEIHNQDGSDDEPARIRIYGIIGGGFFTKGVTAEDFVEELDQITASKIEVLINTRGGSAWDAVAIYNALRSHPAHITTKVEGVALSAGSIIVQAGDNRVMLGGTQMMIHKAWTLAIGDADEMRKVGEILDVQDDIIAGIYAQRTGKPKDHFAELMLEESWYNAEDTVSAGLADEVVEPSRQDTPPPPPDDDTDPEDRPKTFADQLRAVVTAVEQVADETENVITFRSDQGKPPLSEEAVELLGTLAEASTRLADAVQPADETEPPTALDDVDAVYARLVEDDLVEEPV